MYGRHSGQKGGQTSPEDAKGEQAEPLCHAVFTERLFCFLYRLLLFSRVERLPPPIITTFAPTGADLSSRFAEGLQVRCRASRSQTFTAVALRPFGTQCCRDYKNEAWRRYTFLSPFNRSASTNVLYLVNSYLYIHADKKISLFAFLKNILPCRKMSCKNLEKISFRKFKIHFMQYFKIFYRHYEDISWKSKKYLMYDILRCLKDFFWKIYFVNVL